MIRLPLLASLSMVGLAAGALFANAQRKDRSETVIEATRISGGDGEPSLHYLLGSGGNLCFFVGEEGTLLVDSQFAVLGEKIRAALKEISEDKPRYLVNTHWHGDHTGGNVAFGEEGATIVASNNVRRRLAGDPSIEGRKNDDFDAAGWPDVTFDHELSLWLNGEEVRLLHYKGGHTDGDAVVYFVERGVVHMGDLYFQNGFPFIDLGSGGSIRGVVPTLDDLLARLPAETQVVPGHGEVTDLKEMAVYREMLVECIARVEKALAEGVSLAQANERGLLDDYEAKYGQAFIPKERMLATLYEELAGELAGK